MVSSILKATAFSFLSLANNCSKHYLILSQFVRLYRFFRPSWAALGCLLRLRQEPDIL